MLSENAVALLHAMAYRPESKWLVNILPFGSIYWEDEMPSLGDINNVDDLLTINRMFGFRLQQWDGVTLAEEDQQLWDAIRNQVPQWALFNRLELNDAQKEAREEAEKQVEKEFESLADDPNAS